MLCYVTETNPINTLWSSKTWRGPRWALCCQSNTMCFYFNPSAITRWLKNNSTVILIISVLYAIIWYDYLIVLLFILWSNIAHLVLKINCRLVFRNPIRTRSHCHSGLTTQTVTDRWSSRPAANNKRLKVYFKFLYSLYTVHTGALK